MTRAATPPAHGTSILDYAGRPSHFIVALDETGITEVSTPDELASVFEPWTESPHWRQGTAAFERIVDEDQAVLIGTFIEANNSGYAACVARTKDGATLVLRFFDEIQKFGAVIVIFSDGEPDRSLGRPQRDDPMPLRLVQQATLHGTIAAIDEATTQVLGWDDTVVGQSRVPWGHPDEVSDGLAFWALVVADPFASHRTRSRLRTVWGDYRWFETTVMSRPPGASLIEIEMIDVTAHIPDSQPAPDAALLDALAALAPVGVLVVNSAGETQVVNALFSALLGVSPPAEPPRTHPLVSRGAISDLIHAARADPAHPNGTGCVPIATPRGIVMASAQVVPGQRGEPLVLVTAELDKSSIPRDLPKGLSLETMSSVVRYMTQTDASVTFKELALGVGVSEVTARRYLTFLVESGRAEFRPEYRGRGRPRHTYLLIQ